MSHESIIEWEGRATSVIEENEAFRASLSLDLGRRAIDATLADEERFKAGLCGSEDENTSAIIAYKNSHTSPTFYQ